MSRPTKNQLSEVQLDEELFPAVVKAITVLGVETLSKQSGVCKVSIYRYKRGIAITPSHEKAILTVLNKHAKKGNLQTMARNIANAVGT